MLTLFSALCNTSTDDLKYLPSVFIIGDFNADFVTGDVCSVVLSQRKRKCSVGEKISDFGCVEFVCDLIIPKYAKKIKLTTNSLYTEVYIDGKLVSKLAYGPYEFDICDDVKNKQVSLKIVQYSSLGPIFGDVKFFEDNLKGDFWRGTPVPQKTLFGFDKIEFIL